MTDLSPEQATDPNGAHIALRLMCTTDLHGHVLPWDYLSARRDPEIGLSRLAPLIRAHRRRAANTLLFDNGDFLHGNPMADAESERLLSGDAAPHAVAAAMNALGYDAGTLGNHEFNFGLELLRRVLDQLDHPVTSANLQPLDPPSLAAPGLVLRRRLRTRDGQLRTLRIGVLGLAPPQTVEWDRMRLDGRLAGGDMVVAARTQAQALRRQGADIVVVLAHSGLGAETPLAGAENTGRALAALPDIDALFLGHTHEAHPRRGGDGVLRGTPVAQPGRFGSHLGVIDLNLGCDAAGGWRVLRGAARIERPTALQPMCEAATAAPARRSHARMMRALHRPVGHSALPITSHFALVAPDPSLQLLSDAWRGAARRLLAGRPEAALPLLVAVCPFRAGEHGGAGHYLSLPAGPVTERHLRALQPHADRLCLAVVDRAVLKSWLERGAVLFCRLLPRRHDQPLIDPAMPSYGFDVIDGLTWRIDPSRAPGARVSDLRHEGRPLGPRDRFVVAAGSHRFGGVEALPRALRAGRINLPAPPPPEARDAARAIATRDIAPIGPAAAGFHRYRLRLGPEGAALPIDSAPRLGYGGPARTRTPRCPAAMTP